MKKSILSVILVISMVIGIISPLTSFAKEIGEGQSEANPVVCDNFSELKEALESETVKYVKLTTLESEQQLIAVSKTDVEGAIITTGEKYLTIEGTAHFNGHALANNASLISVKGTLHVNGTGTLTYCHGSSEGVLSMFYLNDPDSILIFEEGNYTLRAAAKTGNKERSYGRVFYVEEGVLETFGGNFIGESNDNGAAIEHYSWSAGYIGESGEAIFKGGEFSSVKLNNRPGILASGVIVAGNTLFYGGTFHGIEMADATKTLSSCLNKDDRGYTFLYTSVFYNEDDKVPFNGFDEWRTPRDTSGNYKEITVFDLRDVIEFTFVYPELSKSSYYPVVAGDTINIRFSSAEMPKELSDRGFYFIKQLYVLDFTTNNVTNITEQNPTSAAISAKVIFENPGVGHVSHSISIFHDDYVSEDKNGSVRTKEIYNKINEYYIDIKDPSEYGEPVQYLPELTVEVPVVGDLIFGTEEDPSVTDHVTWETNWYYENDDGERVLVDLTNETFKAGELYECEIVYTARDGYYIPMDLIFTLNGVDQSERAQKNYTIKTATYTKYFRPMVDEVHLTCVRPPIVGDPDTVRPVVEGADEYGVKVLAVWKKNGVFYTGTIEEGVTYTAYIQVTVKGGPGYNFTDDVEATVNGYTVPEANFNANGRQFTYEVEFVATEGCSVTYRPGEALGKITKHTSYIGEEITLMDNPYPVPPGMQFKAWSINGTLYDEGDSYTVTGDTEITAVWEEKNCYVIYDSTNGDPLQGFIYPEGKPAVLADNIFPVPEGKVFAGWLIGEDVYAAGDEYTFTYDVTVYAVWKDISIPGDVNRDTKINLSDVSLTLKHIAKWDVEMDTDAADVNDDAKINLSDVSLILKCIAKWDVELK